jgi:predicted PurR-regulated permease PerM
MTDAGSKPVQRPLFYPIVLLAAYLTYLILEPFLAALTWAVLFGIMFHGMQTSLAARIGPNRAALVTTLVAGIVIVAPAIILLSALAREAPQVATYLQSTSRTVPSQIERLWEIARARSPVELPAEPTDFLIEGLRRGLTLLAPRAGAVVADVFATIGSILTMLFALFFMLRDGEAMSRKLRDRLPFAREDSDRLLHDTRDLVIASVGAGLVVAIVQGVVGGLAFWLVGIGAPAFWGVLTAFCSLLPVVGAALVWVPAAAFLLLSGEAGRGVILVIVGALGISMVDNILRPLILSGRTSVSGLVIFFGLLGGVAAFGFVGLVIGPIILVTTGTLLELLHRSAPGPDVEQSGSRI